MKTFLLALFLSAFLTTVVSAQDIIYLKNGDEIKAKVMAVKTSEIEYKKFENPDGPTYAIEKFKVLMIIYSNGTKDIFNDPAPAPVVTQPQPQPQAPVQSQQPPRTISTGTPFVGNTLTAKPNESYSAFGVSFLGYEGFDYGFGLHFLDISPGNVGFGVNLSFAYKDLSDTGISGYINIANLMFSGTVASSDGFFGYASGGVYYSDISTTIRVGGFSQTTTSEDYLGVAEAGLGFYFKPFAVTVGYNIPDFDVDLGGLTFAVYIVF